MEHLIHILKRLNLAKTMGNKERKYCYPQKSIIYPINKELYYILHYNEYIVKPTYNSYIYVMKC